MVADDKNEPASIVEVRAVASERVVIPGIVKNGMVVPQDDTPLPEGAHVAIVLGPADVTSALQAELAQWEQASDEAWAMIDQWEMEAQ
jgi:hypothetical protein